MEDFRNESAYKFTDISSEEFREYKYPDGTIERFDFPEQLAVSPNGHRLFLKSGECIYVAKGWRTIRWRVKEGAPHFSK